MAMSFSRPDPSSPASIADATFGTGRRGFDQSEVRDFLRMVAAEFGRLQERERFLERELQVAQSNPDLATGPIDDETMTRLLGEEAMRVLLTARESATEIKDKAVQASERLLSEASDDAGRVREEADIEASRRRGDAAADAEAELSMAKQQGREMVNEARAYRERVLSELARRRELAREQIEQLIHGRDRLMQSFERARLVAVDVVAEMQPLGEPDEYVNLTPTTGPLPVMIANSPRPDDSMPISDDVAGADAMETDSPGDLRIVGDGESADEAAAGVVGVDEAEAEAESESEAEALATVDDDAESQGEADETEGSDEPVVASTEPTDEPTANVGDVDDVDDVVHEDVVEDSEELVADEGVGDDVVVDLFARIRADKDVDESESQDDDPDEQPGQRSSDIWDPEAPTAPLDLTDTSAGTADSDEAAAAVAAGDDAAPDQPEAMAGDVDASDSVEPSLFETRDEVVTPLILASAKKLKRVLADEQNEVLDALRRSDTVHNLDALLPWASGHSTRYAEAIAEELTAAVNAGAVMARGTHRKMRKALVTGCVDAANTAIEQWLVTPLRDRLSKCVADGGGDNVAVTKKVRAAYRETKTRHIDETLADIVRTAHGRGLLAGFDPDEPLVWTVDVRHPACPDCDDNALAGAVAAGSEFPTGHTFAPAHPGCRCLLAAAER